MQVLIYKFKPVLLIITCQISQTFCKSRHCTRQVLFRECTDCNSEDKNNKYWPIKVLYFNICLWVSVCVCVVCVSLCVCVWCVCGVCVVRLSVCVCGVCMCVCVHVRSTASLHISFCNC